MIEIETGIFQIDKNDGQIYLIGDIHGDYQCVVHCLVDLCKVCKITQVYNDTDNNFSNRENLEWIEGNNSIVVFCGDLIHRKRFMNNVLDDECSDIYLIENILRLKKEAKEYSGDILIVAGNHEIMNIIYPNNNSYTSDANVKKNYDYFTNTKWLNNYIDNSYAWIKLNNVLIAHGGLCSDYLRYLDDNNVFENKIYSGGSGKIGNKLTSKLSNKLSNNKIMLGGKIMTNGNDIIKFVNDKYKSFFTDYDFKKTSDTKNTDKIGYDLFVRYELNSKKKDNMFWCREWGYSGVSCDEFKNVLAKVDCNKMIIAHCPQFISPDQPKMINFECLDGSTDRFNIARVDMGMSRSFDYNSSDNFLYYLSNNFNRKMAVLKLCFDPDNSELYFDINSVITEKLSCLQYLLLKYGTTLKEWEDLGTSSDWLGFNYIDEIMKQIKNNSDSNTCKNCENCNYEQAFVKKNNEFSYSNNKLNKDDVNEIILCILYPIINTKINLNSVNDFRNLIKNKK